MHAHVLSASVRDWRGALRRVVAQPAYALTVVTVLALGIAMNTVVFSVADAALIRGLPYPNGPRLFELFNRDPSGRSSSPGLLPASMQQWRTHTDLFDGVEAFGYATFVVTGGAEPEQIGGAYVTPGLFRLLGVSPARGRDFALAEGDGARND